MKATITLTRGDIEKIVQEHFAKKTGLSIDPAQLHIYVKSKQNWKSEWEEADFKVEYNSDVD